MRDDLVPAAQCVQPFLAGAERTLAAGSIARTQIAGGAAAVKGRVLAFQIVMSVRVGGLWVGHWNGVSIDDFPTELTGSSRICERILIKYTELIVNASNINERGVIE